MSRWFYEKDCGLLTCIIIVYHDNTIEMITIKDLFGHYSVTSKAFHGIEI